MFHVISVSYYFDQEISCDLEYETTEAPATTTPVQQECASPPASGTHSQSLIILALVGSVLINILIIIVSVFLYHKLQSRNIKRKVPRMVTAAIQMAQTASESTPLSPRTPHTPQSPGYTPLGRLNPVVLPTGMEISNSGEGGGEQMYGSGYNNAQQGHLEADAYNTTQARRPTTADYLQLTPNMRSLSDISSLTPSSDSGLANSRTAILSASLGNNMHRVHKPSPLATTDLDTQVPCTSGTIQKALPPLPSHVTEVARGISRTSNSYDYIEYDTTAGAMVGAQAEREPSHKYLQIT